MKRFILLKWTLYFLALVLLYRLGGLVAFYVETFSGETAGKDVCVVVVDPGHGGPDPGKVGTRTMGDDTEVLEKDVNLQIARKLKTFLEQGGIQVHMTREEDVDLSSQGGASAGSRKKASDMSARVAMINALKPDLTVSIHQNSYPSAKVHGAQVFYYKDSEQGKRLAALLQDSLREKVDPDNHRQIKENTNYYLLKKTTLPIAIVECGFLSSPEEAEMLTQEEYQDRIAWAVCLGILQYLNSR